MDAIKEAVAARVQHVITEDLNNVHWRDVEVEVQQVSNLVLQVKVKPKAEGGAPRYFNIKISEGF